MNLALADIHHHFVRFLVTAIGIGALLTASIGMIGLYRGIVFEALLIINDVGADLWVVEGNRVGPFAERSEVSSLLDRRLEGVPGVSEVRRFIQYNQQYLIDGRRLQVAVTALDFPKDSGSWIPLIAGRHLYAGHYEAIADRSLGLQVGQQIRLGHDDYTIVGVAIGQVDIGGDGMLFVTIPDAQSLDSFVPSEAVLLRRLQHTIPNPNLLGYAVGNVAALMVTLSPGADSGQVQSRVRQWGDVTVLTRKDEEDVLVNGRLRRLKIQILAFVGMTLLVTTTVIALSIYTMTIEKTREIALLKLIGARDRLIVGMILQQALYIGVNSFVGALLTAHFIYPYFPRTVLILWPDVAFQALLVLIMCIVGSWFGIRRAMSVRAQAVLS
jgi:putative ABC transport system permease protein